MKKLLLLSIIFTTSFVSAQQKKHLVHSEETLYSLSKKYKISIEDIRKANPQIKDRNIYVEDVLIIPDTSDIISNYLLQNSHHLQSNTPELNYIEIKVKSKQTLYEISKKYNTTIDAIKKLNPSLKEKKLEEEQILKIPK